MGYLFISFVVAWAMMGFKRAFWTFLIGGGLLAWLFWFAMTS